MEPRDDVGLIDLAIALAKRKRIVLGLPLLAGFLSIVVVLLLPKVYTATARILPPQQKESAAAAILGSIAGASATTGQPVAQALGLRNPNELYAAILSSDTIADRLIARFELKQRHSIDTTLHARLALAGVTRIDAARNGLITIEVDDKDPHIAASMANAYVEELDRLMQGIAVTEAAQRRLFFERQLSVAQSKLLNAEADLRQAIEVKGIAGIDSQTRSVVGTTEQLRAQIAAKQVELDAIQAYATDQNPQAVRLRQELRSMRAQLSRLEGGRSGVSENGNPKGLENIQALRELKFLELTVELLTKQYEVARIDEAKDAVLIQVVDRATAPDYKSKPRRALIVALTVLVVGFLSAIAALTLEMIERMQQHPNLAQRLNTLRAYVFRFRR